LHGEGVQKNLVEAIKWYRQAAAQGHANAEYNVGVAYFEGNYGMPKNKSEAIKLWQDAAEQGDVRAQTWLGQEYAFGGSVLKADKTLGYMWINLAAAQGFQDAIDMREALEEDMKPAEIAVAQQLSRDWQSQHQITKSARL
jgi:TPR repeat protein